MIELGQALKERRIVLGMDLEDVERRTKIRTRYLEAIENGDWSVLPGEVYARGFVRSYAECVGLDGLKLLEQYIDEPHAQAITNMRMSRAEKPRSASTESPTETTRSRVDAAPARADVSRHGADAAPARADVSRHGAEATPSRADVSLNGADTTPNRADATRTGSDTTSRADVISPRADAVREADATPSSVDKPPADVGARDDERGNAVQTSRAARSFEAPVSDTRRSDAGTTSARTRTSDAEDEDVPYVPPKMWWNNNAARKPEQSQPGGTGPRQQARSRERRPLRIGGAVGQGVAVVAAFAILGGAWWWISNSHHAAKSPVASTSGQNTAVGSTGGKSTTNVTNVTNTASTGSGVTNAASNAAGNTAGTTANGTGNTAGQSGSPATISVQPYNPASGVLTVLATTNGPVTLNATAQGGQCWIQVLADGKSVDPNDFIVPGATKTFSANSELRIDLGNVPVVSMTVNGQPITLPNATKPIWVVIKKA